MTMPAHAELLLVIAYICAEQHEVAVGSAFDVASPVNDCL